MKDVHFFNETWYDILKVIKLEPERDVTECGIFI